MKKAKGQNAGNEEAEQREWRSETKKTKKRTAVDWEAVR